MNDEKLAGGCLCGEIRYSLSKSSFIEAAYCHCRICQHASGAPTVPWMTVKASDFVYTQGQPKAFKSSEKAAREFCGNCGTQLVFRYVTGPLTQTLDVTLSSLDNPHNPLIQPMYHIWTQSQIKWFDVKDDLPRHEDRGPDDY
eukprot:TRINITY_DN2806_c0_g2_i1.p1 TRINITY_DN2806_c0_g2~~TRINITY_DN2806_c0_g2_i1.p1  ORF type:complete len:158 (-),score=23.60 TRINITY_DN2806_c0_g2_i1:79-507(-)